MSAARRTRLGIESLDDRLVPSASVLNLTTHGAEIGTPSGAIFQQLDSGAIADPTTSLVRLQTGLLGGLLGSTEQGYNTDARPLQFDEVSDPQLTQSMTLGQIPVVEVNGVAYREFLLTINQNSLSPYLSLDEMRVFLGGAGNLTGYNANTKALAGLSAAFDLDSGGNVSVKFNDNLNRGSSADVAVLVPDAAFAGANPNSFVYVYSKFGEVLGAPANGGFEEWSVRNVPPPAAPVVGTASLSGAVEFDANQDPSDGYNSGMSGVTIDLTGTDNLGNSVSLTATTDSNGAFSFAGLTAGTYTITEDLTTVPAPYSGGANYAGTVNGTADGTPSNGQISGISLGTGQTGINYMFTEQIRE